MVLFLHLSFLVQALKENCPFLQTLKHMSKNVRHFIQWILKVDQDYYPEYLKKMFIINAPTRFKEIWSIIKPWLDKRTQKKIEVHVSKMAIDCLTW